MSDFEVAIRHAIRKRLFNTAVILMRVQIHREEKGDD